MRDAHVSGAMTAYNAVNGTPAPASTYTVNALLRATYGFGGYTTSDRGAVGPASASASADGIVQVAFDVTNTAAVPGATVAQLHAARRFTVPGVELPAQQLAGFRKLMPASG